MKYSWDSEIYTEKHSWLHGSCSGPVVCSVGVFCIHSGMLTSRKYEQGKTLNDDLLTLKTKSSQIIYTLHAEKFCIARFRKIWPTISLLRKQNDSGEFGDFLMI